MIASKKGFVHGEVEGNHDPAPFSTPSDNGYERDRLRRAFRRDRVHARVGTSLFFKYEYIEGVPKRFSQGPVLPLVNSLRTVFQFL